MSGNLSGSGFIVAMLAWVACVILYASTWNPSHIALCSIPADQRVFILKLPAEGPLQQLLIKGSVVTLTAPAVVSNPASTSRPASQSNPTITTATPPEAAGASDVLPTPNKRVEDATVLDKSCNVEQTALGRARVCYACIAVKKDDAEFLIASTKIWVLLQH